MRLSSHSGGRANRAEIRKLATQVINHVGAMEQLARSWSGDPPLPLQRGEQRPVNVKANRLIDDRRL